MNRKNYTRDEALNEVFNNATVSALGKKLYDKVISYKTRHARGQLGDKAANNLLSEFGFIKDVVYTKERKTSPTNK